MTNEQTQKPAAAAAAAAVTPHPNRRQRRMDMCKWIDANKPTMKQTQAQWGYADTTIYRACREFAVKPPCNNPESIRGHAAVRILAFYLYGKLNQADVAHSLGVSRQRVNEVTNSYKLAQHEVDAYLDR